jgi:hypothetical protein
MSDNIKIGDLVHWNTWTSDGFLKTGNVVMFYLDPYELWAIVDGDYGTECVKIDRVAKVADAPKQDEACDGEDGDEFDDSFGPVDDGENGDDDLDCDDVYGECGGAAQCQEPESPLDFQVAGSHYKNMVIQPMEYIYRNGIGFAEGSAIKYLSRHKNKGGADDIRKAIHICELILALEYGQ